MNSFFGCPLDQARSGPPQDREDSLRLLDILRPKASPVPLIRVGGLRDGAYLMPDDMEGIVACFSPGVSNRKHFEDELADRFGIKSHMADKSSDEDRFSTPLKTGMQTFRKLWLDVTGADDAVTLDDWVAELAPGDDDLLLQMDIEGAEYRNLLATSDATLARFRIIVLELHGLKHLNHRQALGQVLQPFLEKLDAQFQCVHAHPNNCCGDHVIEPAGVPIPQVHEVTFLRRDRFDLPGRTERHPPLLPHPLDVPRNVADKEPLFLDLFWSGGRRAPESERLIAKEMASYKRSINESSLLTAELLSEAGQAAYRRLARLAPAPKGRGPAVDLALGKPYSTAKPYSSFAAKGLVAPRQPFFFHTAEQSAPWITIDLLQPCLLSELVVENRTDICLERARTLIFSMHNDPDAADPEFLPVLIVPEFLKVPPVPCRTPLLGETARYVTLWSPLTTALHLSSIQIWGWPAG